jgi:outer membrane receptor protein involved in Fe transport
MKTLYFLLLALPAFSQKTDAVKDSMKVKHLEEIVISASRLPENALKSPVSIEILDNKAIRNVAAPSYFDAMESLKGIQLITPSLGFKVYNARGFTNPTNVRFMQLVDGIDNQAPHIGSPIASALAPNDLDVRQVEIVPGIASALYGLNALNGIANIITLNPFEYQDISFQQKTGINHINDPLVSGKIFSESSLRFAQKLNKKWAFKVNAGYQTGYDWIADNHSDLNPTANTSLGIKGGEETNPAFDGVNSYGNESSNRQTLTLNGKKVVVARTGYTENDVADYTLNNWKVDGALHFRPNSHTEMSYFVKYSNLDNVYQRTNRFRLQGYTLFQQGFTLKTPIVQLKAYMTQENTGSSYNLRSMAENIDKSFKNDDVWYTDFTSQFNTSNKAGLSLNDALNTARQFADKGRPVPHTDAFNTLIQKLGDINNWDVGAALRVKTSMYHVDGQFDLTRFISNKTTTHFLAGFDYRNYVVVPDGNYFINPVEGGQNLTYYKAGVFVEASKSVFGNRLKLGTTLRLDKNQYFDAQLNPRFSAVYSPNPLHNFRISYQSGYRFPSLFEAFTNINSGGVKRVGGLQIMSNGIFENSYFKSSIDAFQAAINNDVNINKLTTAAAIEKNKGLLQKNNYTYLRPEHVQSIELGYKTILLDNKLLIDVDFYYSVYDGFIAQVEANIAKGKNPDSLAIYFSDKKYQDRYRLWTNSKTKVYNYGASLGAKLLIGKHFLAGTNVSYAQLDKKDFGDGLEEAFNTPKWIVNASFGSSRSFKNIGFNINYKWQDSYLWQSSLATGIVPVYSTLDAQVTYALPRHNMSIKLGGTNILNHYYYNFVAGPSIGGLYYVAVRYGL